MLVTHWQNEEQKRTREKKRRKYNFELMEVNFENAQQSDAIFPTCQAILDIFSIFKHQNSSRSKIHS